MGGADPATGFSEAGCCDEEEEVMRLLDWEKLPASLPGSGKDLVMG